MPEIIVNVSGGRLPLIRKDRCSLVRQDWSGKNISTLYCPCLLSFKNGLKTTLLFMCTQLFRTLLSVPESMSSSSIFVGLF